MKKIVIFLLLFSLSASAQNTASTLQLQRRIMLLEQALAPATPSQTVMAWGKAAMTRNGAVQYMLLCPNLQNSYLSQLTQLNWVTGVSSPQVNNFKVLKSSNSMFTIQYQVVLNNKSVGTVTDKILVQKADKQSSQRWCIAKFSYLSPSAVAPK